METLNLFSQPELLGKKKDGIIFTLPVTSRDQSSLRKSPHFSENSGWEIKLYGFSKLFYWDTSLYVLNIFATAAPKYEQKIEAKNFLYFEFSRCKVQKLAGRSTTFKKLFS